MKTNKIMWIVVMLFVSATIVSTLDTAESRGQERSAATPNATPPPNGPDFSKYGIADYDAVYPLEASELERRKRINQRYDNQIWVVKYPSHDTGMIGRVTEEIPPPTIPTQESDLIVTGRVTSVTAHLSNDKRSVYSEFSVKVGEVLKNSLSINLERGDSIMIDRAGGVVRYPHGQTVLYLDSSDGLPEVGREYALFLRSDKKSENYAIVTLHELQETKTIPLDSGRNVDDIKRMGRSDFIRAVQSKLSWRTADEGARTKP